MKRDIYKIDNSIERLLNDKSTLFLDQKELKIIISKLHKKYYNAYYPYKTSEKVILYTKKIPKVTLFKIISNNTLRHQDILGSIMGLNISSSYLGDIIIDNDNYYFYILSELSNYIKENLLYIGNNKITLEELNINYLDYYERKYKEIELIVSSNRIDTVISRLINKQRDSVIELIKNKDVILNYDVLTKNSYYLKENDIFSIRKYGKYKFINVLKSTKKDKLIIKCLKYI
ncbi:MAG: hypothetical protein IJ572_02925 [Bacilli bacterium]|nr:hypothetical protein [Bacilli bacterium]